MIFNKIHFYFILFISMLINNIYSEELEKKLFDFDIGFSNYISCKNGTLNLLNEDRDKIAHIATTTYNFLNFGMATSFNIDISFLHNYNDKNSIGFIFEFGYNIFTLPSLSYLSNGADFKFMVKTKHKLFDDNNNRSLFEAGIYLGINKFLGFNDNPNIENYGHSSESSGNVTTTIKYYHYIYYPDVLLNVGPIFTWGTSKITKSFCFEFGGFYSFNYLYTLYMPEAARGIPDYYPKHNILMEIGVFFRFNYNKSF